MTDVTKILLLDIYGVSYVDGTLNGPLLEGVQALRRKGLKVCFASNMAIAQKDLFWNGLGLRDFGDYLYCSGDLNVAKPAASFYNRVTEQLKSDPAAILFVDDSAANVDAARYFGWQAVLYHSVSDTLTQIEQFSHEL